MAPFTVPFFNKNKTAITSDMETIEPPRRARPQAIDQRVNATARMPTEAELQYHQYHQPLTQRWPGDGFDHRHDDDMGCFAYWHYKIMRFNPKINSGIGYDGRRETMFWTHLHDRQLKSYERRSAEKKAAKAAAKLAKENQRRAEEGWAEKGNVDAKPRRKVKDMLRKEHAAVSKQSMACEPEEDQVEFGRVLFGLFVDYATNVDQACGCTGLYRGGSRAARIKRRPRCQEGANSHRRVAVPSCSLAAAA